MPMWPAKDTEVAEERARKKKADRRAYKEVMDKSKKFREERKKTKAHYEKCAPRDDAFQTAQPVCVDEPFLEEGFFGGGCHTCASISKKTRLGKVLLHCALTIPISARLTIPISARWTIPKMVQKGLSGWSMRIDQSMRSQPKAPARWPCTRDNSQP